MPERPKPLILLTRAQYEAWVETRRAVYTALRALAGVCDGAQTHDKRGFNGVDTAFGKELARKKEEWLTLRQVAAALKMLQKYAKQIRALADINIKALPPVPTPIYQTSTWSSSIGRRWRFYGPQSERVPIADSGLRIHTEDIHI